MFCLQPLKLAVVIVIIMIVCAVLSNGGHPPGNRPGNVGNNVNNYSNSNHGNHGHAKPKPRHAGILKIASSYNSLSKLSHLLHYIAILFFLKGFLTQYFKPTNM